MIDFLVVDATIERPDVQKLDKVWESRKLSCSTTVPDQVSAIRSALDNSLTGNRKSVIIECSLPEKKALAWFVSRNKLKEIDFFYEIFSSKAFQSTLDDETLKPAQTNRDFKPRRKRFIAESGYSNSAGDPVKEDLLGFTLKSCFTQTGMLASDIFDGMAEQQAPTETPPQPTALSSGSALLQQSALAADAMLQSGFANGLCYLSSSAWSSWFKAHSRDRTFVYLDKGTGKITFIITSDTE